MVWLVLGVLLWSGMHLFKRLAPKARKGMGEAGKGMVTAGSLFAVVLMVIGYRSADPAFLWASPAWTWHLNNLLMVVAVLLVGLGKSKSRYNGVLRHPMLTSVIVWAVAHLLVNGDLPSLVLFGGLGLWAAAEIAMINAAVPKWTPPPKGTAKGTVIHLVISAVVFVVLVGIHLLFGLHPVPA